MVDAKSSALVRHSLVVSGIVQSCSGMTTHQSEAHRPSVKKRTLSRQETLQRLRDEFTDQVGRDREALRARLRERALRSHLSDSGEEEENIDGLVEEFLNELLGVDEEPVFFDENPDDLEAWQPGLVKCPLCPSGWLLEPFPSAVTCDGCSEFRLSGVPLSDVATVLDNRIREHQSHGQSVRFGSADGVLFLVCAACGASPLFSP